MDTLLVAGVGAVAVAFLILAIHPTTRPYALRLWWVALAAAVGLVGILLGRKRGDTWDDDADSAIVDIQRGIDTHKATIEADQVRARLASQEARDEHDVEREEIGAIESAKERYEKLAAMGRR
jgi:hypothetical protein